MANFKEEKLWRLCLFLNIIFQKVLTSGFILVGNLNTLRFFNDGGKFDDQFSVEVKGSMYGGYN